MADELMTVATYGTLPEAHIAKAELEAAGIRVALADEEIVGALWHIGGAVGGVKVLVNESDLVRACEIIRKIFPEDEVPLSEEELEAQAMAMAPENAEDAEASNAVVSESTPEITESTPPSNYREECARSLFFVAWLGIGFFPLAFYGMYLLAQVLLRREPLSSRRRFEAMVGGLVLVPGALIGLVLFSSCLFNGFQILD